MIVVVIQTGRMCGKRILVKTCHREAPSRRAASSSSWGTDSNAAKMMSMYRPVNRQPSGIDTAASTELTSESHGRSRFPSPTQPRIWLSSPTGSME